MPIVRRAVRSAIWLFADDWLNLVWGIVSIAVLARLLGPEVFGTLALAGISLGVGAVFLGETITEGLIQFEDLEEGHCNVAFWLNTCLGAGFAIAIMLFAAPLSRVFDTPVLAEILPAMAAIGWLGSLGDVPEALLERELEHKKLVIMENLIGIPCSILTIILALLGFGIWSIVVSAALTSILSVIALFWLSNWRPGLAHSAQTWRDVTRFGRDTLALKCLGYLDDAVPRIALGAFLGDRALGLYSIAMTLAGNVSGLLMGPLSVLAMSVVARLQTDLAAIRLMLDDVFKLTTFVMYPAILGACMAAPLAAPLLLGEGWSGIEAPLIIALLIGLRHATGEFNISILRGLGDTISPIYSLLAGVALMLVCLPIAVSFGLIGITSLVALRVFSTWPLTAWFVQRRSGYPMWNQFTLGWHALLISVIMGVAIALIFQVAPVKALASPVKLGLMIPIGIAIYSSLFGILWPNQLREGIARVRALARGAEQEV